MKGVAILVGIILVSVVFCGIVPGLMSGAGIAMALPVIMVPGEVLWKDVLGGLDITNTLIGTLLTDVLLLLFAFGAVRNMKQIPGRLQGLFEVVTDAIYGFAKSTAGSNARRIFPLMATLFLFLLLANWVKLVPGVESVGLMHCAHEGITGYPRDGVILEVDKSLDPGTRATEADYEACYAEEHADEHNEAADAEHSAAAVAGGGEAESTGGEGAVEAESAGGEAGETLAADNESARSDLFNVTPFVRGATTDLNLTLGLAVIAFVAIQYFGVRTQGIRYFTKFFNTIALERMAKNPMGVMDFGVGLLEIISELSKILSFGFRLFGNLFAGSVLLIVMSFLVSMFIPAGVYVMEMFIGLIQAFVFAMLLSVFSSMAMHGHDSHDQDGESTAHETE